MLGTHLAEVIRRHAHELLSRQDAKKAPGPCGGRTSQAVEAPRAETAAPGGGAAWLQNLLRERVSIRDSVTILEALGEAAPTTRNPILLTQYVRQSLRRQVVKPYLNAARRASGVSTGRFVGQTVESAVEHGEQNSHLTLGPTAIRDVLRRINLKVGNPETPVAVIASSAARYFFRQIGEPTMRNICFLSHNEIPVETKVLSLGVIQ